MIARCAARNKGKHNEAVEKLIEVGNKLRFSERLTLARLICWNDTAF